MVGIWRVQRVVGCVWSFLQIDSSVSYHFPINPVVLLAFHVTKPSKRASTTSPCGDGSMIQYLTIFTVPSFRAPNTLNPVSGISNIKTTCRPPSTEQCRILNIDQNTELLPVPISPFKPIYIFSSPEWPPYTPFSASGNWQHLMLLSTSINVENGYCHCWHLAVLWFPNVNNVYLPQYAPLCNSFGPNDKCQWCLHHCICCHSSVHTCFPRLYSVLKFYMQSCHAELLFINNNILPHG